MPAKQPAADRLAGFTKADYLAAVATNYKGLADFAARYGVEELHEPPIDLPAVLRRLHEVVQEQAAALRKATRAAEAVRPPAAAHGNGNGAAVDPLRELRLRNVTKADLDIAERRGQLVEREAVRTALTERRRADLDGGGYRRVVPEPAADVGVELPAADAGVVRVLEHVVRLRSQWASNAGTVLREGIR